MGCGGLDWPRVTDQYGLILVINMAMRLEMAIMNLHLET